MPVYIVVILTRSTYGDSLWILPYLSPFITPAEASLHLIDSISQMMKYSMYLLRNEKSASLNVRSTLRSTNEGAWGQMQLIHYLCQILVHSRTFCLSQCRRPNCLQSSTCIRESRVACCRSGGRSDRLSDIFTGAKTGSLECLIKL